MVFSFDPIQLQTDQRLAGVKSLLRLLEERNPEYDERERQKLLKSARARGLEGEEYYIELDTLEEELVCLPQFTAYAIVILLHTILEVHLRDCAKRTEERMKLRFGPDDLRHRGIERYATYLSKSGAFEAKADRAWLEITDLRKIRNLVVHKAGTDIGHKVAKALKDRYRERFDYVEDGTGWWEEVWISVDLCRQFTETVEAFSERCFQAVKSATQRDDS